MNQGQFYSDIIKLSFFALLVLLCACAKWPDIVESKADIESLPLNVTSIRARGLSDDDIPVLKRLQSLMHIYFDDGWAVKDAKITDKGLSYLSELQLPLLQVVMLGNCNKITDEGLKYIATIKTVKQLSLRSCTGITDEGLRNLTGMPNLQTLDLRNCQNITDQGIMNLKGIKQLRRVLLGGCKNVSAEGVKKLQELMPNCSVEKNDEEASTGG